MQFAVRKTPTNVRGDERRAPAEVCQRLFAGLAQDFGADIALAEVGVFQGDLSMNLLAAFPQARYLGVDPSAGAREGVWNEPALALALHRPMPGLSHHQPLVDPHILRNEI